MQLFTGFKLKERTGSTFELWRYFSQQLAEFFCFKKEQLIGAEIRIGIFAHKCAGAREIIKKGAEAFTRLLNFSKL